MNQNNDLTANRGCPYTQNTTSQNCACPQTTSEDTGCGCTATNTIGGSAVLTSDSFCVEGCCEQVNRDLGAVQIANQGQIINASVTLRNVCPNRKITLGVTLVEIFPNCSEEQRAFRVFEVRTPSTPCGNLRVNDLRFAVPVENPCQKRRFRFIITANYSDTKVCM